MHLPHGLSVCYCVLSVWKPSNRWLDLYTLLLVGVCTRNARQPFSLAPSGALLWMGAFS